MTNAMLLAGMGLLGVFGWASPAAAQDTTGEPVRVTVARMTHGHVEWILGKDLSGIEVVGFYEPDRALAERYAAEHGFSLDLVYDDLEQMLDAVRPEAVMAFGSIYEHLGVVQAAAPRGIHVMVEKPLALSVEHARAMEALAREHGIHLMTNYETTWYGTTHAAGDLARQGALGDLRKIVVHDGHPGPREIGVGPEFLTWLTDPELNGGGALIDFGCYGADLITWLMDGARPLSVLAVTQQIKPDVYPHVDDEATIVLTYPKAQGIIQASWNWPFNRKDMEVYGRTGYVRTVDGRTMHVRLDGEAAEAARTTAPPEAPLHDPFAYFAALIRGTIQPGNDLSSLPVNMVVVEILDAARRSAREGRAIMLQ